MYNFSSKNVDGQSLVHVLNLLQKTELIGAEIGVDGALTACTLLQNCPNIKLLYLIDNYKPYTDLLKEPYYSVDEKQIEYNKLTAHHNVKWCGFQDRAIFIEEDSKLVATKTQNEGLDFVFIDTYMNYDQALSDLYDWYPKVRTGGLFSGHDWESDIVKKAVLEFRKANNITSFMSTFDDTWMWIKS